MEGELPSAERFERVVGGLVDRIYLDVAEQVPQGSMPRAQAVLGWLSSRDLPYAHDILERARMHYARLRRAPAAA
jgi:hypothetical protein